jgi:hypothetical protein
MKVLRYSLTIGAVVLGVAGVVAILRATPLVSVTRQTCDAIQPGMTLTDASAVVGGQPRWYDGIRSYGGGVPLDGDRPHPLTWVSDDGQIVVAVDADGKVTKAAYAPIRVLDRDLEQLWVERVTRGRGIGAGLLVLFAFVALLCWKSGLLILGAGPMAADSNTARGGLWLGVGRWAFAVCVSRRRAPAG